MESQKWTTLCLVLSFILLKTTSSQSPSRGVCLSGNVDLVMVLDAATSVTEQNFKIALQFIERTLWDADIDNGNVQIGLIVYSSNTHIHFSLGQYNNRNDMIRHVRRVKYDSGTSNTADALLALRTKVFGTNEDRPDARNIAIIITDGISAISDARTTSEATRSKNDGIEIYAIGVGLADPDELNTIASKPLRTYRHTVDEYRNLEDLRGILFQTNCVDAVELPDASGFNHGCGSNPMDLVLLVDTSLGPRYQREIKSFLFDLVEYADIESGNVQIAMVTFNIYPQIQFRLNELSSKSAIQRAIREAPSPSGQRNTAEALNIVRRQILHSRNGNRDGVPDVLLIITTGQSTHTIDQAAAALKNDNVNIFAVGVNLPNSREIDRISSEPKDEHTFVLPSASDLDDMKDLVFAQICTHAGTFSTRQPSVEESKKLDLVFLLHFSNELRNAEFQQIISFIKNTLQGTDIDSGAVRVGAALYRQDGVVMFNLNQYATKEDLIHGISRISYGYRSPYASAAAGLNTVRTLMFNENVGDRADTPNSVILLTDANSNLDTDETAQAAKALQNAGVSVFSVGIGVQDNKELATLASKHTYSFALNDASELEGLQSRLELAALKVVDPEPTLETVTAPIVDPVKTLEYSDKADIFLVFHASSGVKAKEFKRYLLGYFVKLLDNADINSGKVRVSLVAYKGTAQIVFDLSEHTTKAALLKAIKKTSKKLRSNSARLSSALHTIREILQSPEKDNREDVPNAVVIVTDRKSRPQDNGTEEAQLLKIAGTKIFAVGIGKAVENELRSVVSEPTDEYFGEVPNYIGLIKKPEIKSIVVRRISVLKDPRTRKTPPSPITPSPQTRQTDETTTTETIPVTLYPTVRVQQPAPLTTSSQADIVIALHVSRRHTPHDYQQVLQYLRNVVSQTDVNGGRVRLGLLVYGREAQTIFTLDQYSSLQDIQRAIHGLSPSLRSNHADASSALYLARQMFNAGYESRYDVPKALIFITDSASTQDSEFLLSQRDMSRNEGIERFSVGIGMQNTEELELLSSSSDNMIVVRDFNELRRTANDLQQKIYALRTTRDVELETRTQRPDLIRITFPPATRDCGAAKVDLIFVLDSSTSVSEPNFLKMKKFTKDIVEYADIDSGNVRVGVLIYSTEVHVQFHLREHGTQSELSAAIDAIPYRYGSTNTADALQTMWSEMFTERNGDRVDVPNVAIVITDGVSNINANRLVQEAIAAKRVSHVYAIGISLVDTRELDEIASEPIEENRFSVRDFDELATLKEQIFSSICPGSVLPSIPECGLATVDLVFVLDSSTSVSEPNFKKMLRFMKEFLNKAEIDNGSVRVGALIYSTEVKIQFHLNDYTSKATLFNAIDRIPYVYGSTNTADGLLSLRTNMYKIANGNREHVPNVAIIITDGISNINSRRTISEARRARDEEHNIHIYAIGIGLANTLELDQIASPPASDNSFSVQNFDELEGLDEKIFTSICPEVQPIPVTLPPPPSECGLAEVDLVIILDSSTSVGEGNFQKMLQFCKDLLLNADIDSGNVQVGIVLYSTEVHVQFHLNRYYTRADMFRAIDGIEYMYGSTNTAGGIKKMRREMFTFTNGDRPNVPNIAIIMTDGVSNIAAHRTIPEAERARRNDGIHIYAIGIGLTDTRELDAIASTPSSDNSFSVQSFDDLRGLGQNIFQAICPVAPRTTTSTLPPVVTTTTPIPITLPPPEPGCGLAKVDLVIVLDASTSVGRNNFIKMLEFCKSFLSHADIDSGNVRVGLLLYSTDVHIQFHLQDHSRKVDIFNAIDNIQYVYGSTNTADGILKMRTEMFSSSNGDRPHVPNVGIVITDGISNINAQRTIPEAERARTEDGIHIYAIGIGLTDTRELDAIASVPASENSFNVAGFDALQGLEKKVFQAFCPVEPEPPVTECGLARVDLVIILDSSTSVGKPNFKKMQLFIESLISKADVDSGSVRVGVVTYNNDYKIEFHLNRFFKKVDVISAIHNIEYTYGSTNTADGLKAMRTEMFTEHNGDRVDVPNICIIITDGISNINAQHTIPEADLAKQQNIHIYSIGIGLTDTREVDAIATEPAVENSFNVQDFDELSGLDKQIFSAVCAEETVFIHFVLRPEPVSVQLGQTAHLICTAEGEPEPDITWHKDGRSHFPASRDGRLQRSRNGSFIISDVRKEDEGLYRCTAKNTAGTIFSEASVTAIGFIHFLRRPESVTVRLGQAALLICTAEGAPEPDITWQKDGKSNFPAARERRLEFSPDGGFIIRDVRKEDEGVYRCTAKNTADTIYSEASVAVFVPSVTTPTTTTLKPTPAPRPLHAYDLILILDSSVSPAIFNWILEFARRFIQVLSIDNEEFRVGLLVYSTNSHPQFNLNDYTTKAEVLNAIDLVPFTPGQTNTAQAFETVHNRMFTRRNGDRDHARNFIVLITGNEESMNTQRTQVAVDRVKHAQTAVFVIGLDIRNTNEVDDMASQPTRSYQFLTRGRDDLMVVPDPLVARIRNLPQPPVPELRTTPRPTTTTTTITRRPKIPPRKSGPCTSTGDIVFILDSSGSVGDQYFWKVLNFTYSTVDGLDIDSGHFRVGVITFSGSSRNEFFLNSYSTKADIEEALQKIQYVYGFTHTAAALRSARLEQFSANGGDRRDVPNVVVIITDGQSNIQHYQTIPEAMRLKRMGVTIMTIAVGFTGQTAEHVGLTSPPIDENLIQVENYEALQKLTSKLISPLCTDSNLCAESNPCHNGGSCVDGLRSYMCHCPSRFFGTHCDKRCGDSADVVFVLDSSNSVGSESFGRMKTYVEYLIREMNMEACNIHVGAMKYSSAAMIQFGLGTYQDTESITRAIDNIHYTKGQANMGDAIRTLRTSMFNGGRGDRRGVKNIAYLLTDGSNEVHPEETLSQAELAINSGIRIIPIGVSLREREEIESIALSQGVTTIEIADEPQLLTNSVHILAPLFDREDRCLENPCQHGGNCVNEVLSYRCHCISGYSGDNCERRCTSKGDVVFAVDTSRYMTRKELRKVRRFIRFIVKRMQFHSTSFKVGLVDFSRRSIVHLDFSTGDNKKTVLAAMSRLRSRAGDPSPAEALMKARIRIFGGRGEKKERPDYLILVTKSMRGQRDISVEINKLKTGGVKIIGVGIGMTNSDKDYLTASVSNPLRSSLYLADTVSDLKKISDQIMEHMCDDHDKCAENPCRNGGTCMSNHGTYYCQCPNNYAGPHCEQRCNAVADVVFLLDSSGSVGHHNFRKVKDFVHNMVDHMSIGKDATRVAIATFSTSSSLSFYLNDYYTKDAVQNAISGVSYEYGNTNTAGGLKQVRHRIFSRYHGDRPDVQNFLVVITDGLSNINPENTVVEANLIKKHGTHIYAVGVGAFDSWELQAIASEPASANAFMINDYAALEDISQNLIRATCRDSSICHENPCRNNGTCVPGINTFTCQCSHGYKGSLCDRECMAKKDIVFVLDSSGSVGEKNFDSTLKFLAALVEELSGEGIDNEFGFVTYSTDVQLIFSLGRYHDINDVVNAIVTSRYRPGATNTAGGLRTAIELFGSEFGNRAYAENLVILLTDGQSNVDAHDTVPAARDLKRVARVMTVAVGLTDTDEIENIASSAKDIYKVDSYNALGNVKADILGSSCSSENDIS